MVCFKNTKKKTSGVEKETFPMIPKCIYYEVSLPLFSFLTLINVKFILCECDTTNLSRISRKIHPPRSFHSNPVVIHTKNFPTSVVYILRIYFMFPDNFMSI